MRLRVGLTGGIGSGKTEVARRFRVLGALVIDTDALARDALAPGSEALRRVFTRWPAVRDSEGGLARAALGAVVFADPSARAELNAIVHPVVRALGAGMESHAAPGQIVVWEVPLLFETGFERCCDATVLVTAPPPTRVMRVVARSGGSPNEVMLRMHAQIDPALARERATFTIENDGPLEELRSSVDRVWQRLENLSPRSGP